jgi:two-component system sensor histidine kinase BaeS
VTTEPAAPQPGTLRSPLGRRLLVAFLVVALSSVVVLTLAALVGADRGLATARSAERERTAERVADAAATAYTESGGWSGADLSGASAAADAAGATLVVRDNRGVPVSFRGMGPGRGMRNQPTGVAVAEAAVLVAGEPVGTVRLGFPGTAAPGRTVAWSWILGAALVALVTALIVSGYVSRRLTRPLVALAGAAHRFATGDRAVRANAGDAPGELGEVARAFDSMADEVVRAEAVRRQLAADVAHELRTPLAALQAGLEELRDGLRRPDTERLAALHDQSLRLGRVVQDLADLSAAESAALSLRLSGTDLAAVARSALAAQRPQLEAAGLRIEADLTDPVPVRGDPDRLHQAISNLLANAARYCRPGDRVTVRGYRHSGSGVLEVADTGPGIPAEELPHVFERLWRGNHATGVTGSGIGLAVVRELVTAHGGTVAIASPRSGGTTVTIRVPATGTRA